MQLSPPVLSRRARLLLSGALACIAFAILGYHPYAEDGGIYLTALLQRLHPELYPHSHAFAAAHLHYSGYIWLLTGIAKVAAGHVAWLMLCVHVASLFACVYAVSGIAIRSFSTRAESVFAMATMAVGMSLPVAGTALYIADPYVTARSISTPLLLVALTAVLDKRWVRAAVLVAIAVLLHPLMALWGTFFLIAAVVAEMRPGARALMWFVLASIAALAAVRLVSPEESLLAQMLAHSRSYWYLANWEWYEWVGVVAPPVLLMALYRWEIIYGSRLQRSWFSALSKPRALPWAGMERAVGPEGRVYGCEEDVLVRAVVAIFVLSGAASLLLVHPASAHLLLARMQPLRMLHFAYVVFLVLLGGKIGAFVRDARSLRAVPVLGGLAIAACALFLMQRSLYESSDHIELPNRVPRNAWQQAFLWVREHTPGDAVVAMDAHYISAPGEDAQSFRATAQRSSLPDWSKDGGVASVFVALAPEWQRGERAQEGLDRMDDAARLVQLRGSGADWIVLSADARTGLVCPYRNPVAKVCELPGGY